MKYIALYNPLSNNHKGKAAAEKLSVALPEDEITYVDLTTIDNMDQYLAETETDAFVLCGGDGTLNRFANNIDGDALEKKVLYFPCGTGNDFMNDVAKGCKDPIPLNDFLKNLPVVTLNGKDYKFLDNVAYGLDGYCCEVGDQIREKDPTAAINYAAIAIKGLIKDYSPTRATVTVDGVTKEYDHVWLAPTMNGRYYGGGIMMGADQNRLNPTHEVTVVVYSGKSRFLSLCKFPFAIFGKHGIFKTVTILKGHNVTVKYDQPRAVQVDGETFLNISEYSVRTK